MASHRRRILQEQTLQFNYYIHDHIDAHSQTCTHKHTDLYKHTLLDFKNLTCVIVREYDTHIFRILSFSVFFFSVFAPFPPTKLIFLSKIRGAPYALCCLIGWKPKYMQNNLQA